MAENPKEAFKECWGFRNDPKRFVNCLLGKLGKSADASLWTKDSRGVKPTFRERARVRAVLDAWAAHIEPTYLDSVPILQFQRDSITDGKRLSYSEVPEYARRMYNHITTVPGRFIKKVADSLGAEDFMPPEGPSTQRVSRYIGKGLWDGWSIDTYFNLLLEWEEKHVFAAIDWTIKSIATTTAGKVTQDFVVQAVRQWLNEQKSKPKENIYTRYEKYGIFASGKL